MEIEKVVGKRLRQAREAAGLTQAQFGAALAGYLEKAWMPQQVSHAEDGRRKFTAGELLAFSAQLDRSVSFFFLPPDEAREIEVEGSARSLDGNFIYQRQMGATESLGAWNAHTLAGVLRVLPAKLEEAEATVRAARETAESVTKAFLESAPSEGEVIVKEIPAETSEIEGASQS